MKRYIRSNHDVDPKGSDYAANKFREWLRGRYINEIIDTADQGFVDPFADGSEAVDYIIDDLFESRVWRNTMPEVVDAFLMKDPEWAKRIIGDVVNEYYDRLVARD